MPKAVYQFNADIDMKGNRLLNVGTLVPTPMNGLVIDFADAVENVETVQVSIPTVFTTANLAAGRSKEILISSTLVSALTFPSGWKWYGAKLGLTILAKEIRLRLKCYGTADSDVRAEFVAQV